MACTNIFDNGIVKFRGCRSGHTSGSVEKVWHTEGIVGSRLCGSWKISVRSIYRRLFLARNGCVNRSEIA